MAQHNSDDTMQRLTLLADTLDEEMLLSLLVKNLYDHFELFFLKYKVLIYNRAFRMIGHPEEAEDIVQESFINAYQYMIKYPNKIMALSLKAWLYRITRNLVINRKRKEKKGIVTDSIELLAMDFRDYDPSIQPELAILGAEHEQYIHECVNKLPEEFRDLVKVYLYHEVKYSELAKMAGKSVAATKSILTEGIELLSKIIKDADDQKLAS